MSENKYFEKFQREAGYYFILFGIGVKQIKIMFLVFGVSVIVGFLTGTAIYYIFN